MPMAHQPRPAIIGQLVGMAAEEASNLGLHCLRQQHSRAVAQHIGQQIGKHPWLGQLDEIILGHGVSLLRWRSGGVEHPHDTPPYPFTPSPTSAHNSKLATGRYIITLWESPIGYRHFGRTKPKFAEFFSFIRLARCLVKDFITGPDYGRIK